MARGEELHREGGYTRRADARLSAGSARSRQRGDGCTTGRYLWLLEFRHEWHVPGNEQATQRENDRHRELRGLLFLSRSPVHCWEDQQKRLARDQRADLRRTALVSNCS